MKRLILLSIIIYSSVFLLMSQSTSTTAGGDINGSGGQASFTIGQVAYTTYGQSTYSHFGVQHGYELLLSTDLVTVVQHHSGEMLVCRNNEALWYTFQWYKNGEPIPLATDNFLFESGGLEGVYYVIVTNQEGVEFSSETYFYASTNSVTSRFLLYPMPVTADDELTVFYEDTSSDSKVENLRMYDVSGKLMLEQEIIVGVKQQISLSSCIPGSLIVVVNGERATIIVK